MADHGSSGGGFGSADNYVLLPTSGAELWSTSWNNKLTSFRPFPVPDDSGQLSPYRYSAEAGDFGDWIRAYPVFKGGVKQLVTFLLFDPASDRDYDLHDNPAFVLFHAINGAVNSGQGAPSWPPLLKGGAGRAASLTKPDQLFLMQGALMEQGGKLYSPPRGGGQTDRLVVLALSGGTGRKLKTMLDDRASGYNGPVEDYDRSMTYGDPVSLQHGRYIRFCQAPGQLSVAQPQAQTAGFGGSRNEAQSRDAEVKGYDIVIEPTFRGATANLAAVEPLIRSRVKPWPDLLNFPTTQEQVLILARAFPPDVVDYAFRDRPNWLTDDVLAIIRARTSVPVAGVYNPAQPPSAYPQQQPPSAYPQQQPPSGYPQQQPQAGYPTQPQVGYPAQPQVGYPAQPQVGYPAQPQVGYPAPAAANVVAGAPAWGGVSFDNANAATQPYPGAQPGFVDPAVRPSMMSSGPAQPPFDPGYAYTPAVPQTQPPAAVSPPLDPRQAALAGARDAISRQT